MAPGVKWGSQDLIYTLRIDSTEIRWMVAKERDLSRLKVSHEQSNTDEVQCYLLKAIRFTWLELRAGSEEKLESIRPINWNEITASFKTF